MDFRNKLALAPLSGVTDSVFRRICRSRGADITWTEMVSAEGLVRGSEKTRELLYFTPAEHPLGLQLFGADPEVMGRAAEVGAGSGADFLDLNFGCPVPKVVKKNGGSSLMRTPSLIAEITRAVVQGAGGLPVTVKIRSGWSIGSMNYLEVAELVFQAGISAIVLHPRTREQRFSGRSDWTQIARLKSVSPVPVIGSGDIARPADAVAMFESTGCDGVMIGRGALGNPWIFSRARALLDGQPDPGEPGARERFELALEHTRLSAAWRGEPSGIYIMRKHLGWYTRGLKEAAELRAKLFSCLNTGQVEETLNGYLERHACAPVG
jgi:tRNA-dihydrouridine synthase B